MDQFDPWQVLPRQVFTHYSHLLISTAFVVVSRIGCLGVSGVLYGLLIVEHGLEQTGGFRFYTTLHSFRLV